MHLSKGLCPEHDIKLLNYLTINTDKIHTIMEDKEMIINNILAHKKNFGIYKDLDGKEILFYTTLHPMPGLRQVGRTQETCWAEPSWLLQLMTVASGI